MAAGWESSLTRPVTLIGAIRMVRKCVLGAPSPCFLMKAFADVRPIIAQRIILS